MGYRINHSKIISQVNSISDNASGLTAQISLLLQMEQDFRVAWKGQAADAFLLHLSALRSNLYQTKLQISSLASTIQYCADKIQHEDEEAERRAAALKPGRLP